MHRVFLATLLPQIEFSVYVETVVLTVLAETVFFLIMLKTGRQDLNELLMHFLGYRGLEN